jgi:hypothetical protein
VLPLFLAAACGGVPRAAAPRVPRSTTTFLGAGPTTSTSTPAPTTTITTGPTGPAGPAGPAGNGQPPFTIASVTFVSAQMGWVLGGTCQKTICQATMYRTDNGGRSWIPAPAPPISGDSPGAVSEVRFADANDGWVVGSTQPDPNSQLWSTHNGGATWELVALPAAVTNAPLSDLEASDGRVYATFCSDQVNIGMSPVGRDDWTLSKTVLQIGAGPICDHQMTLQRATGWLINVDRTVINGARLEGGSWVPWSPPCATSGGPGELAASDSMHLVAVCDAGVYAGPVGTMVSFSHNGGATFDPAPQILPSASYGPLASPRPGVVIMGGQDDLMGTFDGGATWSPLYPTGRDGWSYVGFTTTLQGVGLQQSGALLMTYDGGHTWAPVALPTPTS